MTQVPYELITQLLSSNAENDADHIAVLVRVIGVKHNLTVEAMTDMTCAIVEVRTAALQNFVESALCAMNEVIR